MDARSEDICFVYNALAYRFRVPYILHWTEEPFGSLCVECEEPGLVFRDRWLVVSMDRLLRYFLQKFIRRGAITFTTAGGEKFTCGNGTGPHIFARFLTANAERRILSNPELALGEVYMDGEFVVENGSIVDVLAILMD